MQVVKAIINIYTGRTVFLKQKNQLIGPRITHQGIPQGSVLSPLLFNLYTIDIHLAWSPNITCLQYVDDFAIYSTGQQFQEILISLKHIAYVFKNWSLENGFNISERKTRGCVLY